MTRTAEPIYFGSPGRPLFGWLHLPRDGARRVGVVLCGPSGYEAICTHRTIRTFAEQAAARGIPALRFDYDGTGDSAGLATDPDRVSHWLAGIGAAIDALKRNAGVDEVCLFGLRLGATLGSLAARGRTDIHSLIAFAPVVKVSAYLREIRALALARPATPPPPEVVAEKGLEEAAGFATTEDTRAALSAINLIDLDTAPAPRVLLLERDDLPVNDAWYRKLTAFGVEVEQCKLDGYADMMRDAHASKVPVNSVATALEWLIARTSEARHGLPALVDSPTATFASPAPLRETAAWLDDSKLLFGVLTEPADDLRIEDVVVLVNSGTIHHIGPGRVYVTLARRCGARGMAALRADLSGVGDSEVRHGHPANAPYSGAAVGDVREAVEFARRRYPEARVHLVGLCSGAYHGLKAAVDGLPLTSVVMVNPLTFFWKPGMSLDFADFQVTAESSRYARSATSLASWLKLLRGRVDLVALTRILAKRLSARARNAARDVARALGIRLEDDLAWELQRVSRQRSDMYFVFSASDPGHAMLREQGGRMVRKLVRRQQLRIDIVAGADHTFTAQWNRDQLVDLVMRHLDRHAGAR